MPLNMRSRPKSAPATNISPNPIGNDENQQQQVRPTHTPPTPSSGSGKRNKTLASPLTFFKKFINPTIKQNNDNSSSHLDKVWLTNDKMTGIIVINEYTERNITALRTPCEYDVTYLNGATRSNIVIEGGELEYEGGYSNVGDIGKMLFYQPQFLINNDIFIKGEGSNKYGSYDIFGQV